MKKLIVQLGLTHSGIMSSGIMNSDIYKRLVFVCSFMVINMLAACSTNDDYLQAKSLPPITVPEGLNSQTLGEIYKVPDSDGRIAAGEFKKPLPPTLAVRQKIATPTMQSFNQRSWLTVPKEASSTWSQLLSFLQQRDIDIVKQDLTKAVIETDWFTLAAQPGLAHRYRFHLEAGLQEGVTEIHGQNVQAKVGEDSTLLWPDNVQNLSQNPVHEFWLLDQISKTMTDKSISGDSLLASRISLPKKVSIASDKGEPVLEFIAAEDRVFNALNNAILNDEQDSFKLYEKSDLDKVIYIDVLKKMVGFLDKITTTTSKDSSNESKTASNSSLAEVLKALPHEEPVMALFPALKSSPALKKLSRVKGYLLVQRASAGNKQRIYIRDAYGRPLPFIEAKSLLESIKNLLL